MCECGRDGAARLLFSKRSSDSTLCVVELLSAERRPLLGSHG